MSARAFKIIVAVLVALAAVAVIAFGVWKDSAPADNTAPEDYRKLSASGNVIVDEKGNEVFLKAINIGGLFVQEGWMCATDISGEYGTGIPDHLTMLNTLRERFGYERAAELIEIYESNFFKESDFDNVKALGFNAVRLPFAYFNLENEDGELTEFDRLDWFVDQCDENDIYLILDLHGAYGSQNGKEHSGDMSGVNLFADEENRSKTVKLWETVAERYKDEKIIAGYDLLNEPTGRSGYTNIIEQLPFYKELYDAVRAVDPDTMLIIESVWEADNLTDPSIFGWENVCYSYHNYNWGHDDDPENHIAFVDAKLDSYAALEYEVPKFIGEFTCFELEPVWEYTIDAYTEAKISYAIWTYKVTGDSSWGAYNLTEAEKVDAANDSYDEIARKWSAVSTENAVKRAIFEKYIK